MVAGVEYEVDCIIYASGFEVGTAFTAPRRLRHDRPRRREAVGALGRRHADQARHARARLPERVHRAGLAGRQPHLERAAQLHRGGHDDRHDRARTRSTAATTRSRSPRRREDAWMELLLLRRPGWASIGSPDCTPGYYNNEGQPGGSAASGSSAIPAARHGVLPVPRPVAQPTATSTASNSGRPDTLPGRFRGNARAAGAIGSATDF